MEPMGIDHLVVAAGSLEEGSDYLFDILGVRPREGGEHTMMGTHNRVLRLGDACYLEVIAINPRAPVPTRRRWFELDSEPMRARLRVKPALIAWALRTDRIEEVANASAQPLGPVSPMSRGPLHWRLTMTEDGRLPGGGLIPFLIQWEPGDHPASLMPESGCTLVSLSGLHPHPETIMPAIQSLGADRFFTIKRSRGQALPSLAAILKTPGGLKTLT